MSTILEKLTQAIELAAERKSDRYLNEKKDKSERDFHEKRIICRLINHCIDDQDPIDPMDID